LDTSKVIKFKFRFEKNTKGRNKNHLHRLMDDFIFSEFGLIVLV